MYNFAPKKKSCTTTLKIWKWLKLLTQERRKVSMGSSVFFNNKILQNFDLEMWPSTFMPKR
jgi:hypothetical protein